MYNFADIEQKIEVLLKIEILGSGGAALTPRPFCDCKICTEARAKGGKYARYGPCYFIHDYHLLIDTPEEIALTLNRSHIKRIEHAIYSHWHPDHTGGMRVFEANGINWRWPHEGHCTQVYLPEIVAQDFKNWLGLDEQLNYLQHREVLNPIRMEADDKIVIEDLTITPYLIDIGYVYAFLFQVDGKNVLIAPDETFGWQPSPDLPELDVLIIPAGLFEFHPLTGDRLIPVEHPVLEHEATFRQTLNEILPHLKAQRTFLMHLEPCVISYDDALTLNKKLAAEYPHLGEITFAYDQQIIEV